MTGCFCSLEPFGACLHHHLCPFSLSAPWFFFDYESSCLNQRAPWNAMAPISFYSEGAVGKGLEPLVAEGAGVRTRVSLFQVLVSLEQHPSLMLGFQQIFHALLGHPPPPHRTFTRIPGFVLPAQSAFPGFCPEGHLPFRLSQLPRLVPHLTSKAFLCT